MTDIQKKSIKRWLISSGITFMAGFVVTILSQIDTITFDSLKDGSLIGLTFLAIRAGVKGLMEGFMFWYDNYKHPKIGDFLDEEIPTNVVDHVYDGKPFNVKFGKNGPKKV